MKALTPLIVLALSVAIFFFYINPTYGAIGDLRTSLNQYQAALKQAQQADVKRDDLVNRYNSFAPSDIDRLNKFMPDSVDNIKLIVDLDNLAQKYGSDIQSIHISSTGDNSGGVAIAQSQSNQVYGTLSVTFNTTMTYTNFLSFVTDMEQSLRLTDIDTLNFKPSDTGSTYDYTVTVKTYWLQ